MQIRGTLAAGETAHPLPGAGRAARPKETVNRFTRDMYGLLRCVEFGQANSFEGRISLIRTRKLNTSCDIPWPEY